ncbi:alpha/beta fold hydrolase [Embleya sp. NBC_00896]|uniref:alpha/beta fold hydrolase n=1 Tax=Embleya sp. NBC_00896 TaxID=2975961 RepID=UPI003866D8E6|nr:alpha/beta hydrolase [Embleya sp. NBC_00896]
MPYLHANGIRLSYERTGRGESVLLIMGSGAAGRVWTLHQTPALNQAGYETVTFDNRGIAPSDAPAGKYSLEDMVADTTGLIEALDLGPCRIVGLSLGALIAQEIAAHHPHMVRSAVLIASRARSDAIRRAQTEADRAMQESAGSSPPAYRALNTAIQMLSPTTLNDDDAAAMWLEILELSGDVDTADGQAWVDLAGDRRAELRKIVAPCRVVSFADDLIAPPHLAAELAECIPNCDLVEIPAAGHLGHLERPEEVNSAIIEFLDKY